MQAFRLVDAQYGLRFNLTVKERKLKFELSQKKIGFTLKSVRNKID